MARRERLEIWIDVLEALGRAGVVGAAVAPSRLRARANLPYDRFWRHVTELQAQGLVATAPLRITAAGERFLQETRPLRARFRLQAPNGVVQEAGPDETAGLPLESP